MQNPHSIYPHKQLSILLINKIKNELHFSLVWQSRWPIDIGFIFGSNHEKTGKIPDSFKNNRLAHEAGTQWANMSKKR